MARAVAPLHVGTTTAAGDDAAMTASTLSERRSAVLYSISRGRVLSRSQRSARRSVRFGCRRDAGERRNGFHREVARSRLAGEHDAVGAVQHGIGHVGRLRARRLAVMGHRLQHLRGNDHRFPKAHRLADERLLQDGDVLDRHLDPQVAAGHHDAVGSGEDFIDILQRARAFDLGQDEGIAAERTGRLAHGLDVRRRFHERLADGVHAMGKGELEALAVALGECRDAQINARQIQPLAGP